MKIEIFQKIIRYYFRLNAKNIFIEFTTNYKFMFTYSSINIYYRFYFLILYNLTFNWIFFEHWILFECKDKKALNFIWMQRNESESNNNDFSWNPSWIKFNFVCLYIKLIYISFLVRIITSKIYSRVICFNRSIMLHFMII